MWHHTPTAVSRYAKGPTADAPTACEHWLADVHAPRPQWLAISETKRWNSAPTCSTVPPHEYVACVRAVEFEP